MLLPPSLDEMIDKNHPVRIVSQVIDQIDISPLEKKYKGGGTSSYHPRVLLKILVYAYLDNVYSSRRIEANASRYSFVWGKSIKTSKKRQLG
jgi:transposase